MAFMMKREVLSLYKQLIREGSSFKQYNFREYAKRRIRDEFKENKNETDVDKVSNSIRKARNELESLHRQVTVANLYHREDLVIERVRPTAH